MTIIGERIKERRLELGWSLRDLAYKMGYSNQSSVARAESGAIDIPQSKIAKFAEVLGVSVAWLMGWEETKKSATNNDSGLSESKRQLLALAEQCTEEDAAKLLQMMEILLGKKQ